ncbi:hypothetical protein SALBM311S_02753 [Streptomyces alboniger]
MDISFVDDGFVDDGFLDGGVSDDARRRGPWRRPSAPVRLSQAVRRRSEQCREVPGIPSRPASHLDLPGERLVGEVVEEDEPHLFDVRPDRATVSTAIRAASSIGQP